MSIGITDMLEYWKLYWNSKDKGIEQQHHHCMREICCLMYVCSLALGFGPTS